MVWLVAGSYRITRIIVCLTVFMLNQQAEAYNSKYNSMDISIDFNFLQLPFSSFRKIPIVHLRYTGPHFPAALIASHPSIIYHSVIY